MRTLARAGSSPSRCRRAPRVLPHCRAHCCRDGWLALLRACPHVFLRRPSVVRPPLGRGGRRCLA
eukprot:6608216-Alexandrium_andersonii.AAC.1